MHEECERNGKPPTKALSTLLKRYTAMPTNGGVVTAVKLADGSAIPVAECHGALMAYMATLFEQPFDGEIQD